MEPTWAARAGVDHFRGFVPPFRAAPRDIYAAKFAAEWRPAPTVTLDMDWDYRWMRTPVGDPINGPGDLRLGAHAVAYRGIVDAGLGWQVKLPNARDEGELGSDETDATVIATIGRTWAHVRLMGSGGVAILGDPIRFANQDDVPVAWISGVGDLGPVSLFARTGGHFGTGRNPARLSAALGAEGQCPYLFGGALTAGLTPAAPTVAVSAWVGWAGCRDRP
jgi:hypothetical protein